MVGDAMFVETNESLTELFEWERSLIHFPSVGEDSANFAQCGRHIRVSSTSAYSTKTPILGGYDIRSNF